MSLICLKFSNGYLNIAYYYCLSLTQDNAEIYKTHFNENCKCSPNTELSGEQMAVQVSKFY